MYSFLTVILLTGFSSCAVGSGCPAEKAETTKFNKKGQLKKSGGKTKLFPEKRRR